MQFYCPECNNKISKKDVKCPRCEHQLISVTKCKHCDGTGKNPKKFNITYVAKGKSGIYSILSLALIALNIAYQLGAFGYFLPLDILLLVLLASVGVQGQFVMRACPICKGKGKTRVFHHKIDLHKQKHVKV